MSIIGFIVMFCWYMHATGVAKLSLTHAKLLGDIDNYKWYHTFLLFPVIFTYGCISDLIQGVWQGIRLTVSDKYLNEVLSEEEAE